MRRVLQFLPGRWWRWRGRPNRARNALQWSNAGWKGLCYQGPGLSTYWERTVVIMGCPPPKGSTKTEQFFQDQLRCFLHHHHGHVEGWRASQVAGRGDTYCVQLVFGDKPQAQEALTTLCSAAGLSDWLANPQNAPLHSLVYMSRGPSAPGSSLVAKIAAVQRDPCFDAVVAEICRVASDAVADGGESPVSPSFVQSTLDAESAALAARTALRNGGWQHDGGAATGEGQQAPAPGGGAPAPPPKGPNPPTVATGGAAAGASAGGSAHRDAASTPARPQTRAATGSAKASSGGVGAPPSSGGRGPALGEWLRWKRSTRNALNKHHKQAYYGY